MVSWQTVQSLLFFFGPLLLPRTLATYRSIRSRPAAQIRPLPPATSYALGVLFFSGLIAFLSTLPFFSPSNIFRQTQSRLQTPAGVLLTRLAALRPLTAADEKLRLVLDDGGLDARLLYARFGPHVLGSCPFARPGDVDAKQMYLLYALPSILAPHLLHLLALGIATSGLLSGREGARWRTVACIAGVVLGAAEVWFIANYDDKHNMRSTRVGEIDFVHWKLQVWRGLAIAAVDGVLGWVIWLQATGRAFLAPPPAAERISDHTRLLEVLLGKARGLGVLRNGTVRDGALRGKVDEYWVKEREVMKDVFEQPEVVEAQRNALRRIDIVRIGREAEAYVDSVLGGVRVAAPP
ncbi:hypothetical protein LTR91_000293 [Friedmanniomyces endolithicus]|uniref:Uncharacterized protein n=1 Tax=Friedmanniomyces endolithicus TaxID=329885 RepID=A0AAN6L223_9PEZI|nr:hypothetical protein LTR35_007488 [Friedmanniomyces endolithicus]KAK0295076.1 hypothetical protein LTS00_006132 [Friedmanniomyces endolithicus]KAK0317369.1 hypothetical protein LTR82_011692 [Friedmanniomyces endolithicus]KAK0931343.1 hypothetical protein LTR57_000758 [Friedmanniomyces endolithicus]KAK1010526.1 hypothetical protein LTR54_005481 [Friedmanniomyces endolithicus]